MNVETYIENQIAELEAELSDKRVELASCIQPADWAAFSTSAAKKLNKAYGSFCWAIRWRVTWGWFAGTSSIQMGSRTQTYFLKHGAFRLVAAVEQAAFVRFPAPGDYAAIDSRNACRHLNGRWPSTSPRSLAQALTICSGP